LLLSMTGYGDAHHQEQDAAISVELRTVNNRYFKLVLRASEGLGALENEIESLVRQQVKRGTVQMNLHVTRQPKPDDYRINQVALESYRQQLLGLCAQWGVQRDVAPQDLLELPGVVEEDRMAAIDPAEIWPRIEPVILQALEKLQRMRQVEGDAMAASLRENCETIAANLTQIESRAPLVAEGYRGRLEERLRKITAEHGVAVETADILREVSLFAERTDISEETVRLRSHLDQFLRTIDMKESSGRKLDFLTQEMFRETNTIGAKANDVEIAQRVIEIKAAIEKMREMVQNVE